MTPPERSGPGESVDISAPSVEGVESRAAAAAGLIPTAALVFGALLWLVIVFGQSRFSETRLVGISGIAMFPTTFGIVGRQLRKARLRQGKPAVAVPLLVGVAAGFGAMLALAFFYGAIWPSL